MAGDGISVVSLSDSDVIFTLPVLLLPSAIRPRQLVIRANATATNFAVRTFLWIGVFGATEGEISMQRKILALAAAAALGAAMTTGAMAAHVGGGGGGGGRGMSMGGGGHAMTMGGGHTMTMGGGHAMTMEGGHAMTMGGARMNTFAVAPHANFVRPGITGNRFVSTWGHPATGAWANRTWAGGNWGHHHHHRHFFVGGGLYAFGGYSYDCYSWPYYSYPYNSCYGNGYVY
jgi:hypothetical protein